MRPRDGLVLGVLLVAAVWLGWDRLAGSPVGHYLAGECEARASRWHFRCDPS